MIEDFTTWKEIKDDDEAPKSESEVFRFTGSTGVLDCPWCNKPLDEHEKPKVGAFDMPIILCEKAERTTIISSHKFHGTIKRKVN